MTYDKPARRMTLRQLLTSSEKCARDLIDHVQAGILPRVSDCRDLSRPVRRRSHYPTLVAVQNALKKLQETNAEVFTIAEHLQEQMEAIHEHAVRERVNRK